MQSEGYHRKLFSCLPKYHCTVSVGESQSLKNICRVIMYLKNSFMSWIDTCSRLLRSYLNQQFRTNILRKKVGIWPLANIGCHCWMFHNTNDIQCGRNNINWGWDEKFNIFYSWIKLLSCRLWLSFACIHVCDGEVLNTLLLSV